MILRQLRNAAILLPAFGLAILQGCNRSDNARPPKEVEGYAPVYGNPTEVNKISSGTPQTIVNTGKIYIKDQLLYQVEVGKGLHVINIANPASPVKVGFIHLYGIQEMAIQGNMLYANNHNDLVTVNISNLNNVTEVSRVKNAFHLHSSVKPPTAGWFECVDESKGVVTGWKMQTLHYPKCRY